MKSLVQTFLAGVVGASTVVVLMGATNPLVLRNDGIQFPDGSVQTTAAGASRSVYLTDAAVLGSGALAACVEPGFHMASIWEISKPASLVYAQNVATAETDDVDLGGGLPAGLSGWLRTGSFSYSISAEPGVNNCEIWTSNSGNGTIAWLNAFWPDGSSGGEVPGWRFQGFACGTPARVWCVED